MVSFQQNITSHAKSQKQTMKRQNIKTKLRYSKNVGLSDQEFKTTMTNMSSNGKGGQNTRTDG